MPYFLHNREKKTCVVKGSKDAPGETVKCHDSHDKALAHLRALYVHVEDAILKAFGLGRIDSALYAYKDVAGKDRWISVSTAELWDRQDELFTKSAMDYDIAAVKRTGEWPELRQFHVRGFKLGMCDSMYRVGIWAVDSGYWYDTPYAQAVKDLIISNDGRWKTSRGFHSVEATGLCQCDTGLLVKPLNYIFGIKCSVCGTYHPKVSKLKQLQHLKARTFDISVTDVPVLADTAIAAYSVMYKETYHGTKRLA